MEGSKIQAPLTKEDALKLLFTDKPKKQVEKDCFDKFGNYSYPTDLVVEKPNIAVGTSEGFQFLNYSDLE